MCGIIAYVGTRQAYPILIKGLKRLEYRGYDSAGVALLNGPIQVFKRQGKVSDLENHVLPQTPSANIGIGHTRWATHGEPNDVNAHPHLSDNTQIVLVHNGIIENYAVLKQALQEEGFTFQSDTDTEVLVNLIQAIQQKAKLSLEEAVRQALTKIVGAYAIAVMHTDEPTKIVAARKSSPLIIGVGKEEFFIASDASPIIEYTRQVIYLQDNEVATIQLFEDLEIKTLANEIQSPIVHQLDLKIEQIEKGNYDYFMLKEIHEQPKTVKDALRGRINKTENWLQLGGLIGYMDKFLNAERITIVACGTSWHAGLIAEYLIEDLVKIPVEVEYASEFRYRKPIITDKDVVIAISQSGQTADTFAALELAKEMGAFTYGVINTVGSSIARLTDSGSYIHAGPEIGVASTKAFTGQVTLLSVLAIILGYKKQSIDTAYYTKLIQALAVIPEQIQLILDKQDEVIQQIAKIFASSNNALYLGRGYNFPVALEGALKLKEISYIHAEGYPAAEMKHGPIALIDENMPVFVIATNQSAYEKIVSNIQEVKARKGKVVAIITENAEEIRHIADYVIEIPTTMEPFTPLLSVIPLQLLSYYMAVLRGCDVDQPRNLAKSVTVE